VDFDGVITLADLQSFLRDALNIDVNRYRLKIDRLFKILDLSKSGSLYHVDFEKLFTTVFHSESSSTLGGGIKRAQSALQKRKIVSKDAGFVINWK
jgi:hypothetical protein